MATSETAICNRALGAVGTRSTIADLDEGSNESINCRLFYEDTRDEVLRMAHWNFAKKTAILSLLKSAPGTPSNPEGATAWSSAFPAPPWLYEYTYPSDCLLLRYIVPQVQTGMVGTPIFSNSGGMYPYVMGPAARFEIATDLNPDDDSQITVVLTNMYQAIACYTAQITNTNLFDKTFEDALSAALAAKLAIPLTGDKGLSNLLYQRANDSITLARATNGNEGLNESVNSDPDWIRIRNDETLGLDGYGFYMAPYSSLYSIYA